MKKPKVLVFTGAGVSAESGIQTFRDAVNGLWNNHKIEDVCTPEAWKKNPTLVLNFYNERRSQLKVVEPNLAHTLLADLETFFEVTIVTQNVDDLHERAGSSKVIHLHGELRKVRSSTDPQYIIPFEEDVQLGDLCPKGGQLRPHIVWFGEYLEEQNLQAAQKAAEEAEIGIIVGTSLQVYPANEIPTHLNNGSTLYIIDPKEVILPGFRNTDIEVFQVNANATVGVGAVYKAMLDKLQGS